MKIGLREIVFLVLIVGLLGLAYARLQRNNQELLQKEASTAMMKRQEAELKQSVPGIDDLQQRITDLQKAIVFFNSKLPQAKEIDAILNDLWKMAEANALQTKTIKTLRSENFSGYSEQPIELSLRGDFNGFYAFLLQLETLPRITRLTQMSLQKVSSHEGEMEAQLTLSIFFEPDGAQK